MKGQVLPTYDIATIIPFRLREGGDWRRQANKNAAVEYLSSLGLSPQVVDDARSGDEQFNRSAAYNRGIAANPNADIFVFYETDLIVPEHQLDDAIALAGESDGLVVPFSKFLALDDEDSVQVRDVAAYNAAVELCDSLPATQVRGDYQSIGAVNIVSRSSIDAIGGGYDEGFAGAWYDDDCMEMAFKVCCGPTRFVDGPGWHMYHLPGAATGEGLYADGSHLSDADRAATESNKARWMKYRKARTPETIRALIAGER